MMKQINISLDEETVEKLKDLAEARSDENTRNKEKDGNVQWTEQR